MNFQASDSTKPANLRAESGLKSQPSSPSSPLTPPSNSSLLVIGLDSMIGSALAREAEARGIPCQGTSRRTGARWHLDLAAPPESWQLPESATTAILCAARTRLADCEAHPEETRAINVTATVALARLLNRRGTRIVFISSNQVFPSDLPNAPDETTPVAPVTAYGSQKAAAEQAILDISPKNAVIRLTKVISPDHGLLAEWKKSIAEGNPISACSNIFVSPISLSKAAATIMSISLSQDIGIFHVIGGDSISFFALAKRLFADKSIVVKESVAKNIDPPPALHSLRTSRIPFFEP